MVKIVNFFKCYNPTSSARRLELPTAFSLQFQGVLPKIAFLRDCYTNMWPVKIAKIDNDSFFCDGWEKFVQDNSLELRDVLVFRYNGDNLFDVKLLGLSHCDKEGVGHSVSVEDKNEEDDETQAEQVADDGASKDDGIERNEGLCYIELEDDSEKDVHGSDDDAEVYMEAEEIEYVDAEDEDEDEDGEEDDTENNEDEIQEYGEAEAEKLAPDREIKIVKTWNFFKCYNPTTSKHRLELPTAFSLQLQGALPEMAFLRDRYTNLWPAKICKIDNDCFFCDGWEKFVQDNSLESRDVLVFQYDGDNLFDVKLLGLSGCDKEGVGHFNTIVEDKNEENGEAMEKVVDDGASKEDNVERNEDLYHMELEDDSVKDIHDGAEDENVNVEYLENNEDDEFQENIEAQVDQVADSQRLLDPYGNDIFSSGLAIRPRNPYFVTKIRKSRRNDLYIPKETIKDFQLDNLPEKMFLIDPQNRQFQVKIIRWKDDRVWYRGGWKSLCAVNFLREEDTCICEFVGGKLRVHFVRSNN